MITLVSSKRVGVSNNLVHSVCIIVYQNQGEFFKGKSTSPHLENSFLIFQLIMSIVIKHYLFWIRILFRDMVDQNLIDDEELLKPVEVHCDYERIVEEDSWIDGANCIHLAAKFMPMALELLFSVSKHLPKLTHSPNKNGQAPLHIAARNKDTLSTK